MKSYAKDVHEHPVEEAQGVINHYPEGHVRSAPLPMLHLVQSEDGYVSPNSIELCAGLLGLDPAEASAVATFCTQYKRCLNGEYTMEVYMNLLCTVMGDDEIWGAVCEHLGIRHEEATTSGKTMLEALEYNAACGYAPVVMVNWELFDNQTPESAVKLMGDLQADNSVGIARGPKRIPTFRESEHLLAGFESRHTDKGASAGDITLLSKRVAESHGWGIPADPGWSTPEKEGETQ